jgi:uncharacterized protein GlcG (DUF336 family)
MTRAAANRRANKAQQRASRASAQLPLCVANRAGRAKTSYRSRAAANKSARMTTNRNLYPYACSACGQWHLASTRPA